MRITPLRFDGHSIDSAPDTSRATPPGIEHQRRDRRGDDNHRTSDAEIEADQKRDPLPRLRSFLAND
jgi:hypothetical protein